MSYCLNSLNSQSWKPEIIFVDDGNYLDTIKVVKSLPIDIVYRPIHPCSYAKTPLMASVKNSGLERCKGAEYVLMVEADTVFPPNYIERIISSMETDGILIASGQPSIYKTLKYVHDSGRITNYKWWEKINGGLYPIQYDFERYIELKAGRKKRVYPLRYYTRAVQMNGTKAWHMGRSMRLTCTKHHSVVLSLFSSFFQSPRFVYWMLKGYLNIGKKPLPSWR